VQVELVQPMAALVVLLVIIQYFLQLLLLVVVKAVAVSLDKMVQQVVQVAVHQMDQVWHTQAVLAPLIKVTQVVTLQLILVIED
jgi:hypothetical protein